MTPENDSPYSEPRYVRQNQKDAARTKNVLAKAPKMISCHFCGNTWNPKNRYFVCGACHAVYDATRQPLVGFAGELRVARMRANISRQDLANLIGCHMRTILGIENGRDKGHTQKGRMLREKLRIWVESTKSPIDRRKEIDDMFKEGGNVGL